MAIQKAKLINPVFKFAFIIIAFTVLPFFIGLGLASRHIEGSFTSWVSLKSPSEKIIRIVDYSGDMVWVKTESGAVYYANNNCNQNECWVKTDKLPIEDSTNDYLKDDGNTCKDYGYYLVTKPRNSVQCFSVFDAVTESITYFVLVEDGTVWKWSHSFGGITDIEPERCLIAILAGPIGLIFGLVFAILFHTVRTKRGDEN